MRYTRDWINKVKCKYWDSHYNQCNMYSTRKTSDRCFYMQGFSCKFYNEEEIKNATTKNKKK